MKKTYIENSVAKTHYLWHLAALGVISFEKDNETVRDTLWDQLGKPNDIIPSTVVMIDVGCSFDHPNLRGRVDTEASIDFTAGAQGQKLARRVSVQNPTRNFEKLDVDNLRLDGLDTQDENLFEELVEYLKTTSGQTRKSGDVEARFASHGTSVAGLIVGGPEIHPDDTQEPSLGIIPYFGVDPFSRLVSLRTGFDDDPLQFVASLLYAWSLNADVIVMPRGLPDPTEGAIDFKEDFKAELESWSSIEAADLLQRMEALRASASKLDPLSAQDSLTQKRLWTVVKALFVAISKHIPIVCASGNDGESQLLYPANLAMPENGIIAVGAVASTGYRSAYSNYGEGLTLVAPSDDMIVFNRHQLRDPKVTDLKTTHLRDPETQVIPYSSLGLLSTDIGGIHGYNVGHDADEDVKESGFYTQFGGTSGAAALVAGVIALVRRAERINLSETGPRDGPDIKTLLRQNTRDNLPGLGDPIALKTDCMNADTDDVESLEVFFGAGLIDAHAAVSAILK